MCRYISLATLRCEKCDSASFRDARMAADSLATKARSSAAVLHARTDLIRSLG